MPQTLVVDLRCDSIPGDSWVTSAEVREAISEPTRATIKLVTREDIDEEAALGQPASLEVTSDGAPLRRFHLVVAGVRFEGLAKLDHRRRYVLDLVHEIALLQLRTDARIFQDKDAGAIVAEVLRGAGIPDDRVTFSLQRTPVVRPYCVQYRESDLDFVSRLLEHEGIFYIIHHDEAAAHTTFADAQSAFEAIAGETCVPLLDHAHGGGVSSFALETVVTPGQVAVGDYNLNTPSTDLTADRTISGVCAGTVFEYTAGHQTPSEGQTLAEIRMQELLARRTVGVGASDRTPFRAGCWFELEQAGRAEVDGKYLLTSVEHRFVPRTSSDGEPTYDNHFICIPHAARFRPALRTPRPRIGGVQSAVVTGPPGAEIHTERLGRMKGKFFWDRLGEDDDTSSCWMRVAQLPLGGAMALARVGWEMAVTYFDGDPDRPMAVARLYNAEKTSPYTQPRAKARMALQTPSTPGGGKSNEIRMDDSRGSMELFVNASKDFDSVTGNNKTEEVGANEKRAVGSASETTVVSNQTVVVGGARSATITGELGESIGADRNDTVGASETVTVGQQASIIIGGSDTELTGGSHMTLAGLGVNRTSVGSQSLTVSGSMISAAGLGVGFAVAGVRSETIGGLKLAVSGGPIAESVFGAYASTVGGVCVQAAGGNRSGSTKGPAAVTVGGLVCANAASNFTMKAKKISIKVLGVANLLGGGGVLNMTPGSAAFVGLVGLDASGSIKISGNPNLVG